MIEGLASSVATIELRKVGLNSLADALEAEFIELRAQRDKARDLACDLEGKLHAQKIQETKNA